MVSWARSPNLENIGMKMSRRPLGTFLGLLAAASLCTAGNSAQAYTVGSSYDPNIFSGVGTFFVPDPPSDCLTRSAGIYNVNASTDSCQGVVLESAALTVTDGTGGSVKLYLPAPAPESDVTAIVLNPKADPVVVGFNTLVIPLAVVAGSCIGDLCGDTWGLQWESGIQTPPPESPEEFYDTWLRDYLIACDNNPLAGLDNKVILYENGKSAGVATHVSFTPEPGSLGLLLGALGAGWLARRRKLAA